MESHATHAHAGVRNCTAPVDVAGGRGGVQQSRLRGWAFLEVDRGSKWDTLAHERRCEDVSRPVDVEHVV